MKIRRDKVLLGTLLASLALLTAAVFGTLAHLVLLSEFDFDLLAPPHCHRNEEGIREFTQAELSRHISMYLIYPTADEIEQQQQQINAARKWIRAHVKDACYRYGYNYNLGYAQAMLNEARHDLKQRRKRQRQLEAVESERAFPLPE